MAREIWKNNASTTLNGSITNSATSIVVTDGSVFPTPGTDEFFYATIEEGSSLEVVKVTGRSSNTLTVVRGQQGTTGTAFGTGATIENRLTTVSLETLRDTLGMRRFKSGSYYTGDFGNGSGASVQNRLCAHPFWTPYRITADRIGCDVVSGVASTVIRLGIYEDAGGYPGDLLLAPGTVDSSSSGGKEITISQILDAGVYWLAAQAEGGTPSVRNPTSTAQSQFMPVAFGGSGQHQGWFASGQTPGALADPFPTPSLGSGPGEQIRVYLRIA